MWVKLLYRFLKSKAPPVERPADPCAERRRGDRRADGQATFLFPLRGRSHIVEIVDVGHGGLRLAAPCLLGEGSRHWLLVFYEGARRRFLVEVAWAGRRVGTAWHCGARVLALDGADQLHWRTYLHALRRAG